MNCVNSFSLKKFVIVVAALVALPGTAAAELKIGVVNFDRLASESPQFSAARGKLEDEFAPKLRDIQTRGAALQEKAERLQKDAEVMGADERAAAERELRNEERSIIRDQQALKEESDIRQRELLGPIQQQLIVEVQAYGDAEGYDLIVAEGYAYASTKVDVTNAVLERLKAASAGN